MGFLDNAKDKLTKAVDQHGDKIHGGIDKAGRLVNERTGGKHADKVERATGKARGAVDSLDPKKQAGTTPPAASSPTPPPPAPDPSPATDPLRPPSEQPGLPTDPTNPATG